jgi:hypothetical protein
MQQIIVPDQILFTNLFENVYESNGQFLFTSALVYLGFIEFQNGLKISGYQRSKSFTQCSTVYAKRSYKLISIIKNENCLTMQIIDHHLLTIKDIEITNKTNDYLKILELEKDSILCVDIHGNCSMYDLNVERLKSNLSQWNLVTGTGTNSNSILDIKYSGLNAEDLNQSMLGNKSVSGSSGDRPGKGNGSQGQATAITIEGRKNGTIDQSFQLVRLRNNVASDWGTTTRYF